MSVHDDGKGPGTEGQTVTTLDSESMDQSNQNNLNDLNHPELDSQSSLIDEIDFAVNQEPRCPCLLLLDTSGSMRGKPIEALNAGLSTFKSDLMGDPVAVKRVEAAVVAFDDTVRLVQDFVTPERFEPPVLTAQGLTHIGKAIHTALKDDGILGVIDHVGPDDEMNKTLHRMRQALAERLLGEAGFSIEARSDILSNSSDDHTKNVFDESLGRNTDRFIIKAVKS